MLEKTSANGLLDRILKRKATKAAKDISSAEGSANASLCPDSKFTDFSEHPLYKQFSLMESAAELFRIGNPFFKVHEGKGGAHTIINGKSYCNYSHYNYLGLNGDPRVNTAAMEAMERYGTSAGASRLVAGERPIQRELEKALAEVYGT